MRMSKMGDCKTSMNHLRTIAFKKQGICLPCFRLDGNKPKTKELLDRMAKEWGATCVLSQDKRFAKFTLNDELGKQV